MKFVRTFTPRVLRHKFLDATAPLRVLPDFLIIGAQKCGTSSLYYYLTQHPCVTPAQAFIDSRKETRFFTRHFSRGTTWYRRHFPLAVHKHFFETLQRHRLLTGEATPSYAYYPHALRRIAETVPEAKLILLLRDPVERAFSHYKHAKRLGKEELSFEEAISAEGERLRGEEEKLLEDDTYNSFPYMYQSYLRRGHYAEQVERVFSYVPKSHLLVLDSADFFDDPQETYNTVLSFLGLPEHQLKNHGKVNEGRYVEEMNAATRERLQDYFSPHNEKLFRLLGRSFTWQGNSVSTEVQRT